MSVDKDRWNYMLILLERAFGPRPINDPDSERAWKISRFQYLYSSDVERSIQSLQARIDTAAKTAQPKESNGPQPTP